ncbi:MAG: hypothetical protein LBV28_00575, partial [Puniceicoccales bacterium]|nr:hypothetical protein [Puniceicoccales bacterium]
RPLARAAGKDILVAFVCLDSGVWSQRLYEQALSRPAFAADINKRFVCVMLDYPRTYTLPPAQHKKNTAMSKAWDVATNPIIILADATGRPYAVTGYRNIGATDYAQHLIALQAARLKRDQNLANAARATGQERAAALAQALRDIDENILLRHYGAELTELKKLDPDDATGLISDIEFTPKINALRARVTRLIRQQKDYQGALDAVDSFIEQNVPRREHLQRALFLKLLVYSHENVRNHAAAVELMDRIIAINPASEQGMMAVDARARANSLLEASTVAKNDTSPQ